MTRKCLLHPDSLGLGCSSHQALGSLSISRDYAHRGHGVWTTFPAPTKGDLVLVIDFGCFPEKRFGSLWLAQSSVRGRLGFVVSSHLCSIHLRLTSHLAKSSVTHGESKPKRIAQRHLLVISVSLATCLVCFVPNSLEKVLSPPTATPALGSGPFPWDLKPLVTPLGDSE